MYYSGSKKTSDINKFIRTSVIRPRDLFAKYGERVNPRGIHSTSADMIATVMPEGGSVIQSMIAGQEALKKSSATTE